MPATPLTRDCPAIQIPHGTAITLPQGTLVHVTQALGGSYTVHAQGGLYRITAQNADALGLTAPPGGAAEGSPESSPAPAALEEQKVWDVLKTCFDPEIPLNIVDLGLIYNLSISPRPDGTHQVNIKMTLTAPGCGMGTVIAQDAQEKLVQLPGVGEANVEIVWDPPWHQSMITPAGRLALGLD